MDGSCNIRVALASVLTAQEMMFFLVFVVGFLLQGIVPPSGVSGGKWGQG